MYENRIHATESFIGTTLWKLKESVTDPRNLVEKLLEAGCEVTADGTGSVIIRYGQEVCSYPLGVTEIVCDKKPPAR